jgi:hypothetical protein
MANISFDVFSGNIYFFYSFDVGDDIDLKSIHDKHSFARNGTFQSHLFKTYHKPLSLNLKAIELYEACDQACIYSFGALSLRYRFEFEGTINSVNRFISEYNALCGQRSIEDARTIFNLIKSSIRLSRFYHMSETYHLIQIDPHRDISAHTFKEQYGFEVATLLRAEKDRLSEYKKNEILRSSIGYYRGSLLIIDCKAALVYDNDYKDILDIFDFGNMRYMELQYFDRTLDKQLDFVYDRHPYKIPFKAYFPLLGMFSFDPIGELAKLRVDISVILERLWSTIKFSDEPYYVDVYNALSNKLDFEFWEKMIDKKLEIIRHMVEVYDNRVSAVRDDVLNILIIVLIFIECVFAIINHTK